MRKLIVVLALSTLLAFAALGQNAPMEQQKICMERAKQLVEGSKDYRERLNQSPLLVSVWQDTNHFNVSDGICYATTQTTMVETKTNKVVLSEIYITNAFEGDAVAHFAIEGANLSTCFVEATKCQSKQEFLRLAMRMQFRRKK